MVNDDLPGRIISGRVIIKPNVKEFSGSSVIFDDGTVVDEVRDTGSIPLSSIIFQALNPQRLNWPIQPIMMLIHTSEIFKCSGFMPQG